MCVIGGVQTFLTLLCVANATWALWMFCEVSYKCWCYSSATKNYFFLAKYIYIYIYIC
jgi:hypothetical protein